MSDLRCTVGLVAQACQMAQAGVEVLQRVVVAVRLAVTRAQLRQQVRFGRTPGQFLPQGLPLALVTGIEEVSCHRPLS